MPLSLFFCLKSPPTNRKVNALENTIIPRYRQVIKFIEDKLDEESLEELVRMKLIGGALARRRE